MTEKCGLNQAYNSASVMKPFWMIHAVMRLGENLSPSVSNYESNTSLSTHAKFFF